MSVLDPIDFKVGLLLHCDGASGSGTFTDSSNNALGVTSLGGAAITTALSKFGGACGDLQGGKRLNVADSPALNIGSGDFTIEGWYYCTSAGTMSTMGTGGWYITVTASAVMIQGSFATVNFGCTIPLNTWFHLAITRSSGIVYAFLDGVSMGAVASTASLGRGTLAIGCADPANNYGQAWSGYMDEVRITVGEARYLSGFTRPIDAFPDPTVELASAYMTLKRPVLVSSSGSMLVKVLPSLASSIYSGAGSSTALPAPAALALGHDSTDEYSANLTLPSLKLLIRMGAGASTTLPKVSGASTGTVTITIDSTLSLPPFNARSTGTVAGVAGAALSLPEISSSASTGALCAVTLSGGPTVAATGTTGAIGKARVTLPLFAATADASAQNHGSVDVTLQPPRLNTGAKVAAVLPGFTLTAIGSATITATYEAYAVNLKHTARPGVEPVDEATRYTNFPFTHVIRHKGSYYGANSAGLYLLEGTTDDTAPITWSVKTAMTDFKSPQRKTVASAYFGGRLGPADTITLHAGEGAQTQPYSYTTPRGALAQNYRQAFGKGIKQHRYYALAASGNGEMALDNIDLDVHNMTRRI